ncbi:MAG: GH3 auxin-responsive promoter family protein, partial [Fulvivirga sp.]
MGLLGSIVKTGIELNQKFSFENEAPQKQQETQLRALLEKAKDTSFGKYYGFSELLQSDDLTNVYKNTIPIFDYHQMHDQWWKQQLKFEDITWPGKPNFFALSSGTTGKSSKRIPITSDFLQSMKDVGASQVKSLPDFNFPEELFESEILMLSSSANLSKHENGHLEGEISGINVSNFPDWYETFYRPGKEIAAISNWDERLKKIVEEAPDWNIGAIAGIPSWVLLMLKEIIDYHQLDTIHDIWPNLTVYASGGVAFETYRSDFNAITKKPLVILDTYLASEGFFAFTARPNTMNMQLALHHGYYYEFVPFDDRGVDEHGNLLDKPCSLSIDQVALDQEYVLIVSTCAGAWRYQIGDVI